MCILISSKSHIWNISHSKKDWRIWEKIYIGLHVKYRLFSSDFEEYLIFSTNFRKISNFEKYQISWNTFSGSRVVVCGRTGHDEADSRVSQFLRMPPQNTLREDLCKTSKNIVDKN
jgi:hypothetical protein